MAMSILGEHLEACRAGWQMWRDDPIWRVADNRYGLDRSQPHGAKWQLSRAPWTRQILEDYQRRDVEELVLMAPSQGGKTAPMLIALAWTTSHQPAPTLWLTGDDNLSKTACEERVIPTLERCPDCEGLVPDDRFHKTIRKVRTKFCTIDIAGAQSATVLEQNPYARIFADECRQYPPGSLQKLEKRQRSYTEAKRALFSTPEKVGDEFDERYKAGTQNEWVWPCIGCGSELRLNWKELRYGNSNDNTGGNGDAGETRCEQSRAAIGAISIRCAACGRYHPDQPVVRRHIVETGHWEAQNPNPAPGVSSYHWNALLPPWIKWRSLVEEWKRANELMKYGNVEPLKVFVCETLGEPWEDRGDVETMERRQALLLERRRQYDVTGEWADEAAHPRQNHIQRFIGVDVQADVFYWRCRRFGRGGVSRGMTMGRCFSFEELEGVRVELNVPPLYVMIDSGFRTQEVYRACARYGWTAIKGDEKEYFTRSVDGKQTRNVWQPSQAVPHTESGAAMTRTIPLFIWSNPALKDMLELYMNGGAGDWQIEWEGSRFRGALLPLGEYRRHLLAEEKRKRVDNKTGDVELYWHKTGDDHWRDAELHCLVGAMASGVLSARPLEGN